MLELIFEESRLQFVHAMSLYVFSVFENSITLAKSNIFSFRVKMVNKLMTYGFRFNDII